MNNSDSSSLLRRLTTAATSSYRSIRNRRDGGGGWICSSLRRIMVLLSLLLLILSPSLLLLLLPSCCTTIAAAEDDSSTSTSTSISISSSSVVGDATADTEEDAKEEQADKPGGGGGGSLLVHELGYKNFVSIIGSSTYTMVLFYDSHDQSEDAIARHDILNQLAIEFSPSSSSSSSSSSFMTRNINITFSKMDIRKHTYIRYSYSMGGTHRGVGHQYYHFYRDYDDLDKQYSIIPMNMINSTTFMKQTNKKDILPTFPSRWMLFYGEDGHYNILNCIDEQEEFNIDSSKGYRVTVNDTNYEHVKRWIAEQARKTMHFAIQGLGNNRLSFGEADIGPRPAIKNRIYAEAKLKSRYYASKPMDTINWLAVQKMKSLNHENEDDDSRTTMEQQQQQQRHRNMMFEIKYNNDGESLFYRFNLTSMIHDKYDAEIMREVWDLLERYLSWADSYENLWDEERKQREDEHTNYGHYLSIMNEQIHEALFDIFDDIEFGEHHTWMRPEDVPNLRQYYEDIIFGYGRSPTSLRKYLNQVLFDHPDDAQDDIIIDDNIELYQRIRESMSVREIIGIQRHKYQAYFRMLWIQLHSIMSEFHTNISRHYITYRKNKLNHHDHDDDDDEKENKNDVQYDKDKNDDVVDADKLKNRYPFQPIDVIDMDDTNNHEILSNYSYFEEKYIITREPFVLSNVHMTDPYNYTLDFLVERCGYIDVTEQIKQSRKLGDETINSWGGLQSYTLPREIMSSSRRRVTHDDDEDDEDDEDNVQLDKSISLEQFVRLTETFDNLYLHDLSLIKNDCSNLFWSKSVYDPPSQQYFRIPSVIGQYDIFQRLSKSGYANTWPSLFIGRKGSNSKLHIDSGATGFWMFLVSGRKRWIIYNPSERPFLYERLDRNSFIPDVLSLKQQQQQGDDNDDDDLSYNKEYVHDYFDATYPLLHRASNEKKGYEYIQEPGQLIYVPPSCPHAVENLDDIIGIAFNSVPRAGVVEHLWDTFVDDRRYGKTEILLRYLISQNSDEARTRLAETTDPLYITLGEYIAQ